MCFVTSTKYVWQGCLHTIIQQSQPVYCHVELVSMKGTRQPVRSCPKASKQCEVVTLPGVCRQCGARAAQEQILYQTRSRAAPPQPARPSGEPSPSSFPAYEGDRHVGAVMEYAVPTLDHGARTAQWLQDQQRYVYPSVHRRELADMSETGQPRLGRIAHA